MNFFVEDENNAPYNPKAELQIAAGYYNSATSNNEKDGNSFLTNGFSSFIGSDLSFNLEVRKFTTIRYVVVCLLECQFSNYL